MSQSIELPVESVRAALVAAHLKPGAGGVSLIDLLTPHVQKLGLEWRPVFRIVGGDSDLRPGEHSVLCDAASGKPVDSIVEILTEAPQEGAGRDWLYLGSRYFANRELADAYCDWRRAQPTV